MIWNWLQEKSKGWRQLPIALVGFVLGPTRYEAIGGKDYYLNIPFQILVNDEPQAGYAVTHLQKKSRLGFLVMWPFCFHVWFTFKFQEQDNSGAWVPNSEKVFYWRFGAARWDAGDGKYICPTWYGPGLHWD